MNCRNDDMETALMWAVKKGHDDCASVLLENGAEIEVMGDFLSGYKTPLMLAAERGSMRCLSLLLEKGACVNQINVKGLTALMFASNENIVKALVASGADVNQKAKGSETEHIKWMTMNRPDNIDMVCEGTTALFHARSDSIVEALLAAGANVNEKDYIGRTALFHASCRDEKLVEALVEAGINVNERDSRGKTALFYARNANIVEALVSAGADVNAKDLNNGTALGEALHDYWRKAEVAIVLVEAGADVNNDGKTALFAIMEYGSLQSVRTILSAGLKINVLDYTMGDIVETLRYDKNEDVLDLLFAAGEDYPKYLHFPQDLLPESEINLKHLCREAIRKHLLKLDPHTHLFGRVPRLGLPSIISDYLLYNQTLDHVDDDCGNIDDDEDDDIPATALKTMAL